MSLKFIPNGSIRYIPALVSIMAWRRPLSEQIVFSLCVTRPQWVNDTCFSFNRLSDDVWRLKIQHQIDKQVMEKLLSSTYFNRFPGKWRLENYWVYLKALTFSWYCLSHPDHTVTITKRVNRWPAILWRFITKMASCPLQCRYNESDDVPNHQPHDCLPNGLFWRRSRKTI